MAYKAKAKETDLKMTPKAVMQRIAFLKTERSNWENNAANISRYMNPGRSDMNTQMSAGSLRDLDILDNTGIVSCELLAGFMHGELTSPNTQFFELTTGVEQIDLIDIIRETMQKISSDMNSVIANSNFHTEAHPYWIDMSSIGMSVLTVQDDDEDVVRFECRHIKNVFPEQNNKGVFDKTFEEIEWNICQLIEEFGEEVCEKHPDLMRAKQDNSPRIFKVINAVYPRSYSNKPNPKRYLSNYILCIDDGIEIAEEYYREHPYIISRWVKYSEDKGMGRGPGWKALPDARTLNRMTEDTMIAAQKMIDPPLQAPDDTFVLPIRTRPGGLNYYRAGTPDRITPLFNGAQIDFGYQALEERRNRIREAFYVDQLRLRQNGPQMTATEVMQRRTDAMRLLSPMIGRQTKEFLRPLIERVFEIMRRRGLIQVPEEVIAILEENKLDGFAVTYSSPIAKAQKVEEGNSIQRTFQAVAPLVAINPRVMDNFDPDKAARIIAKNQGYPQSAMRSIKERDAIRDGVEKAQQEAVAAAQQAATVEQAATILPAAAKVAQVEQQAL